ncbi:hypothetical protein SPRG_10733 [Saprolegnia parasitica CBS 223.65]|uniref:Myb-like domain-containing protein n=1 Tax=Saprolegnia parasitica (strain CBS 223.65) TaxID=695850 RepID=A0A067CAG4_SAPPC|nr:hypothetical protein SPRG_10733 [Saprolegnia parasitica CBS 223.65]KDO23541.1 hypothetical protein SPRG_10733 [Saprolegnia parasitica CBS 223.65]|eukprot:XP_012205691.1 hypothetical protein SPRG_10733 [Saprolegnia parasitica CBS 223.65]
MTAVCKPLKKTKKTKTKKTKWTKDQLADLKLVKPKRTTWKKVQLDFPDHSAEDCRQKWHSEFTSTNKGAWTLEEDDKLIHARTLTTKWTTVAEIVETRSYRQCQTRWERMQKKGLAVRYAPPRYQPVEELETTTELPPTDDALDFRFLDLDLGSADLPGTALHTPCGAPPQTTETRHVEPAWHAFLQKAPRCHPVEELETMNELPPTDDALDFRFLDLDLGSGDLPGTALHTPCGAPPQTTETEQVEPAWYAFMPAPTLDAFASAPSNMDSMDRITQRLPAMMAVVEAEEDATSPETAADELNSLLEYMQANMRLDDMDEPMPLLYA